MSLSPESYRKAVARVSHGDASCLVYLDRVTAELPSGCDGWPLREEGGLLCMRLGDCPPQPFPPPYQFDGDEASRRAASRALVEKIAEARAAYLKAAGKS